MSLLPSTSISHPSLAPLPSGSGHQPGTSSSSSSAHPSTGLASPSSPAHNHINNINAQQQQHQGGINNNNNGISPHYDIDHHQGVLTKVSAGVLAAAATKSAVAPMDRVKLVLQLQQSFCSNSAAAAATSAGGPITMGANGMINLPSAVVHSATATTANRPYQGILDCFRRLCAEQGTRSLWRGNSVTILCCLPNQALNVALRDRFRVAFLDGVERKEHLGRFVLGNIAAGGMGSAISLVFVYPLDMARTRLAVDGAQCVQGIRHCLATLFHSDGVAGLYRGFCASLVHTFASRAIFFGIFDSTRLTVVEQRQGQQLSFLYTWSMAQSSIIVSSLCCYPLDTVRRRFMLESDDQRKRYRAQLESWRQICQSQGPTTLYKGALSNSMRCTSGALILAVYYEVLKHL